MESQWTDKSPLEQLIKTGGYEVSLTLLSYIASGEDAPHSILNLRKTCKLFKKWIDNIPSCKAAEVYSKISASITISRKSLQQFEKCQPPPFVYWFKITNVEYFNQPGLQEEKSRLLEFFVRYCAPRIRKLEITDLSDRLVEHTHNRFTILEELSTNSLLFSPGSQQRLLTRLRANYPCLRKVSLPLKSSLLHGLSNVIISKQFETNFELSLTAGHDRSQEGCFDTDWNPVGFVRFVKAINNSSSTIQLLNISSHRILEIIVNFEKHVFYKFFSRVVWIEMCKLHLYDRIIYRLLRHRKFPNLTRISDDEWAQVPRLLRAIAPLDVTHLEFSINTTLPANLPPTLNHLALQMIVTEPQELNDEMGLLSQQCPLLSTLELSIECDVDFVLRDGLYTKLNFANLRHLTVKICYITDDEDLEDTTRSFLFEALGIHKMPLLSLKVSGKCPNGNQPVWDEFARMILQTSLADTLIEFNLEGFRVEDPDSLIFISRLVKCNRARRNGRDEEYRKLKLESRSKLKILSPVEQFIKTGGSEVSLTVLSYLLNKENAPDLILNLRRTCKVFKDWIDHIPSCKSDKVYSKVSSKIAISQESLQQFEENKPPPFVFWLQIENIEYFDEPGMEEEKSRLLGNFINYWAPRIRKLEVANLSVKFAEQTQNKFVKLEEIYAKSLLFSPGNQQRLLAKFGTTYPCLKKVSLPLKSSFLHGLSNLIICKSKVANFELVLTAGHDHDKVGCYDTLWDSRGYKRFVSATNESSSSIQLMNISVHRIAKITQDFKEEVHMKFFMRIVGIEKCELHRDILLLPLLRQKAFPNLKTLRHNVISEVSGVLSEITSLNIGCLEILVEHEMPTNLLPVTLTDFVSNTIVDLPDELHKSLNLLRRQCPLLVHLDLSVQYNSRMELESARNFVRFPNLRYLKLRIKYSHVDSSEIARETLLNMSLFGEIPYLYLKISGTYISGGKPRSIFKNGYDELNLTGVFPGIGSYFDWENRVVTDPNLVPLLKLAEDVFLGLFGPMRRPGRR